MMEHNVTNISPIGLSFALLMGFLIFILPRRYVIIPFIMTCFFLTLGQKINLLGSEFTMLRFIILFGWIRLLLWNEFVPLRLNVIDAIILSWAVSLVVMHSLMMMHPSALVNRLGYAYDALGFYFLFRFLIHDVQDFENAVVIMAIMVIPLSLAFLLEHATGRNVFSVLGGVPEVTWEREGSLRCQGPFSHPILAGTVGATSIPLLLSLWFRGGTYRGLGVIGVIAATTIIITSASSGPLMAGIYGMGAMMLWPLHRYMRYLRWGLLILLVILHMVMTAPVWFLIARLSSLVGGTGWHRSELIDQAIQHFDEWWLWGTRYTAHWGLNTLPFDPDMVDITNQYILEGVRGGLLQMILFVLIIVFCFRNVGRALQQIEDRPFAVKMVIWSMGVALFTHVVSFISVSYFDQLIMLWYLLLASISSVSGQLMAEREEEAAEVSS
jgi:hypothetical protein